MIVMTYQQRLQAMMSAIIDSVLPAIPKSEPAATETATLVLGFLGLLADQCEYQLDFQVADLRANANLLNALVDAADGGPLTAQCAADSAGILSTGLELAAIEFPAQQELVTVTAALNIAADRLVAAAAADGSAGFRDVVESELLRHGEKEILRARVSVRSAGFEDDPGGLPEMSEVLSGTQ
jgi:hypothetical protein